MRKIRKVIIIFCLLIIYVYFCNIYDFPNSFIIKENSKLEFSLCPFVKCESVIQTDSSDNNSSTTNSNKNNNSNGNTSSNNNPPADTSDEDYSVEDTLPDGWTSNQVEGDPDDHKAGVGGGLGTGGN